MKWSPPASFHSMCLTQYIALGAFVGLGALSCAVSQAQTNAFEDFSSYAPPAELNGLTGGTGWSGGWIADASSSDVISGGLTLGAATGGPGALQLNKNAGPAAQRPLSATLSDDIFFVSFLFSFATGAVDNGDRASIYFNSSSGPSAGFLALDLTDVFASPKNQDGNLAQFGDITVGQTYLIAARFSKSISGAGQLYDQAAVWVDPAFGDQGTPDAQWTGVGQDSSISSLGILTEQLEEGTDLVVFDRILLGRTWSDVVPVPEPAAVGLWGLAAVSVAIGSGVRRSAGRRW